MDSYNHPSINFTISLKYYRNTIHLHCQAREFSKEIRDGGQNLIYRGGKGTVQCDRWSGGKLPKIFFWGGGGGVQNIIAPQQLSLVLRHLGGAPIVKFTNCIIRSTSNYACRYIITLIANNLLLHLFFLLSLPLVSFLPA